MKHLYHFIFLTLLLFSNCSATKNSQQSAQQQHTVNYADVLAGCLSPQDIEVLNNACAIFERKLDTLFPGETTSQQYKIFLTEPSLSEWPLADTTVEKWLVRQEDIVCAENAFKTMNNNGVFENIWQKYVVTKGGRYIPIAAYKDPNANKIPDNVFVLVEDDVKVGVPLAKKEILPIDEEVETTELSPVEEEIELPEEDAVADEGEIFIVTDEDEIDERMKKEFEMYVLNPAGAFLHCAGEKNTNKLLAEFLSTATEEDLVGISPVIKHRSLADNVTTDDLNDGLMRLYIALTTYYERVLNVDPDAE